MLGRQIDLYLEDGATTDSVAEAKASTLVKQDKIDVIFGGIYSSSDKPSSAPPSWRAGRLTDVWQHFLDLSARIEADQYKGGSISPLIANSTATSLTRTRIEEIERLIQVVRR